MKKKGGGIMYACSYIVYILYMNHQLWIFIKMFNNVVYILRY